MRVRNALAMIVVEIDVDRGAAILPVQAHLSAAWVRVPGTGFSGVRRLGNFKNVVAGREFQILERLRVVE
ncbi:hypothetical protein APZ15_29745 [Burkholderia cepacia ATCC 25416]|nr:hypothetical protein APZ15_29745 [Burkholderia cepacia ATCC 25416]